MTVTRKTLTFLTLTAGALGWLVLAPPDLLRVGANYTAKIVCSNVFIAGRNAEQVLQELHGRLLSAGIDPLDPKVQAICDVADAVRQCLHLRAGQGREMVKVRDKAAPGPCCIHVGQACQGCAFAGLGTGQKLGNQLVDLGPDLFRDRRQGAVKHPQRAKGV